MAIALMTRSIARASCAVEEAKTVVFTVYRVNPNVPVSRPSHAACCPNDLAPTRPQGAGAIQNDREPKPSGDFDTSNDPESKRAPCSEPLRWFQILAQAAGTRSRRLHPTTRWRPPVRNV